MNSESEDEFHEALDWEQVHEQENESSHYSQQTSMNSSFLVQKTNIISNLSPVIETLAVNPIVPFTSSSTNTNNNPTTVSIPPQNTQQPPFDHFVTGGKSQDKLIHENEIKIKTVSEEILEKFEKLSVENNQESANLQQRIDMVMSLMMDDEGDEEEVTNELIIENEEVLNGFSEDLTEDRTEQVRHHVEPIIMDHVDHQPPSLQSEEIIEDRPIEEVKNEIELIKFSETECIQGTNDEVEIESLTDIQPQSEENQTESIDTVKTRDNAIDLPIVNENLIIIDQKCIQSEKIENAMDIVHDDDEAIVDHDDCSFNEERLDFYAKEDEIKNEDLMEIAEEESSIENVDTESFEEQRATFYGIISGKDNADEMEIIKSSEKQDDLNVLPKVNLSFEEQRAEKYGVHYGDDVELISPPILFKKTSNFELEDIEEPLNALENKNNQNSTIQWGDLRSSGSDVEETGTVPTVDDVQTVVHQDEPSSVAQNELDKVSKNLTNEEKDKKTTNKYETILVQEVMPSTDMLIQFEGSVIRHPPEQVLEETSITDKIKEQTKEYNPDFTLDQNTSSLIEAGKDVQSNTDQQWPVELPEPIQSDWDWSEQADEVMTEDIQLPQYKAHIIANQSLKIDQPLCDEPIKEQETVETLQDPPAEQQQPLDDLIRDDWAWGDETESDISFTKQSSLKQEEDLPSSTVDEVEKPEKDENHDNNWNWIDDEEPSFIEKPQRTINNTSFLSDQPLKHSADRMQKIDGPSYSTDTKNPIHSVETSLLTTQQHQNTMSPQNPKDEQDLSKNTMKLLDDWEWGQDNDENEGWFGKWEITNVLSDVVSSATNLLVIGANDEQRKEQKQFEDFKAADESKSIPEKTEISSDQQSSTSPSAVLADFTANPAELLLGTLDATLDFASNAIGSAVFGGIKKLEKVQSASQPLTESISQNLIAKGLKSLETLGQTTASVVVNNRRRPSFSASSTSPTNLAGMKKKTRCEKKLQDKITPIFKSLEEEKNKIPDDITSFSLSLESIKAIMECKKLLTATISIPGINMSDLLKSVNQCTINFEAKLNEQMQLKNFDFDYFEFENMFADVYSSILSEMTFTILQCILHSINREITISDEIEKKEKEKKLENSIGPLIHSLKRMSERLSIINPDKFLPSPPDYQKNNKSFTNFEEELNSCLEIIKSALLIFH